MNNEDLLAKERDSISSIESLEIGESERKFWSLGKIVESDEEDDEPEVTIKYRGNVHLNEGYMKFEVGALVRKDYSSFLNKFFDELMLLLKENPALYQEFYPLINQEFESNSFHYDRISWIKLHAKYFEALLQYKMMTEELFSCYQYPSYSAEEFQSHEEYEMEFLEIFETMKLYCEAYNEELKISRSQEKPNCFPHIQLEDYPRGVSRAIPKEQLAFLPMFGGMMTLEGIENVIKLIKKNQPIWRQARKQLEESEKKLKNFCINQEIVHEYIGNLRESSVLNLTLLEKFLVRIDKTPVYFWDPQEGDNADTTVLKLRREPTEILTAGTFKTARHCIMGVQDNIFDIVDFNAIKICRKTPQRAQKSPLSLFWCDERSTVLRRKNSKDKTVHFWDEVASNNQMQRSLQMPCVSSDELVQCSPKKGRL